MNDMKKLFYLWFLGARECRGLRGEEFTRPIVRYLQKKEEECEPSKVTVQISSKGIKLVADSVRHLVPSHAVTYVSQGRAPDDDIVSVIMLLYNPITKCPVHLHAYRCDSVDTANSLREHFQALVDLPHNQKKIRELERRLHAHGLYPGLSSSSRSHSSRNNLLKSVDTGIAGSNRNSVSDSAEEDPERSQVKRTGGVDPSILHASFDPALKSEQERIASLYDSLAAELRDKLNGALSGKSPPLLLPPKDYDPHQHPQHPQHHQQQHPYQLASNKTQDHEAKKPIQRLLKPYTDNGSSSGLSSGIGSDLDDPAVNKQQQLQQHEQRKLRSEERHLSSSDNHRPIPNLRRKDSGANCRSLDFGSSTDFSSFDSTHNVKRQISVKRASEAGRSSAAARLSKTRSFHEENAQRIKDRRVPYQEIEQKDRFPGLDRDTARVEHLQCHKSSELLAPIAHRFRTDSVPVVVEPLGKNHFRAVRQPN